MSGGTVHITLEVSSLTAEVCRSVHRIHPNFSLIISLSWCKNVKSQLSHLSSFIGALFWTQPISGTTCVKLLSSDSWRDTLKLQGTLCSWVCLMASLHLSRSSSQLHGYHTIARLFQNQLVICVYDLTCSRAPVLPVRATQINPQVTGHNEAHRSTYCQVLGEGHSQTHMHTCICCFLHSPEWVLRRLVERGK